MRKIYANGIFVFASLLVVGAGCGVESDSGDAEQPAAGDEATAGDDPGNTETTEALAPRATPTCNTSNVDDFGHGGLIEVPWFSSASLETDNCNMVRGTHSVAVEQLQESLNACYGKGLMTDSDFGMHTEAALRQVQTAEHIQSDGQYGPQTRDHMCHVIVNGGGACRRKGVSSLCPRP